MITVSVIIPVYNVELYLEHCLESIVNQTEKFYEVILVNDGSTDSSKEICERYCRENANIRLITQKNRGLSAARNAGLANASGEYIVFVDSDDYVDLHLNERIRECVSVNPADIVYYNAEIQYDIKTEEPAHAFKHMDCVNGLRLTGMEYFRMTFPTEYIVTAWIAAYKRAFLEEYEILFPEGLYYEDNYFHLQVISNAQSVLCIPDVLYIRRCRENSIMTGEFDEKKCRDLAKVQSLMWEYCSTKEQWLSQPDLLRRFIAYLVLSVFYKMFQCSKPFVGRNQREILTNLWLKKWLPLFQERTEELGENLAVVLLLRMAGKHRFEADLKRAECIVRRELLKKMQSLPLDKENMRVGIYGIGRHTVALIKIYKELIGKLWSDLFFIVTCDKKSRFCGRPLLTCEEIPENIDYILLSSRSYQQEMKKNLLRCGIAENRIIFLYDGQELCDLVVAEWVLNG